MILAVLTADVISWSWLIVERILKLSSILSDRLVVRFSSLLLFFLISLLFFHDYIFLYMEYKVGGAYGLNLWKEVVSVGFIAVVFFNSCLMGKLTRVNFGFFVGLILLFIPLLMFGDFSDASLRTFRSLFTPFVFAVLIGYLVKEDTERRVRVLFSQLQVVAFVVGVYGLYQLYFINEWSDFWYFDPLVAMGFELKEYNSFREGLPRISSFFTSSLEFSFFLVFVFFVNFSYFLFAKQASRSWLFDLKLILNFVFLVFLVFLIFKSTVRSAQVCWVTAFVYMLFLKGIKTRFYVVLTGFLYVVSLSVATFVYISLGYTDDLSALGRLVQWDFVLAQLFSSPLGLGFSSVGPGQSLWFDSLWLNLVSCLGVVSVFIFSGFVYYYLKVVGAYFDLKSVEHSRVRDFSLAALVVFPVFLYAAFFQAFYNSTALYLLLIIISVVLHGAKYAKA